MSVPRDEGYGGRFRQALLVLACGAVLIGGHVGAAGAQEDVVLAEVSAGEPAGELWSKIVERYEVVVLSRGLLLEPLSDGVQLRTIELGEAGIALDGDLVSEATLRERLGDSEAELILELSRLSSAEQRRLFSGERGPGEAAPAEPVSEPSAVAETETTGDEKYKYKNTQVVVGNSLTIDRNEIAREAVVFGGPLYVYGKVAGDAAAIGGSVTIGGEVTGDVVAVGGDLTLEPGAEVLGDVVSVGGEVDVDDEARVIGQIIEVPFGPSLRFGAWPGSIFRGRHPGEREHAFEMSPWRVATGVMWETFGLLVVALLACLALLVARRPLERMQRRAAAEPWKAGLVGLVTEILVLPLFLLVCLILVISIIGIPLVLLLPFAFLALLLVAFVGYCGVALGIGRFLQNRFGWRQTNVYLVLLLGVLAIQIWSFVGELLEFGWGPLWFFAVMFCVFGALIKYIAWTVGLGAAVLTRFGTAEGWSRGEGDAPPPVLPPPTGSDFETAPQAPSPPGTAGLEAEEPSPPPPAEEVEGEEPPRPPGEDS